MAASLLPRMLLGMTTIAMRPMSGHAAFVRLIAVAILMALFSHGRMVARWATFPLHIVARLTVVRRLAMRALSVPAMRAMRALRRSRLVLAMRPA